MVKEFTVSFETNEGDVTNPIKVIEGNSLTLPKLPIKEGYLFKGWFTDVNLSLIFDETIIVTENITLYAKWDEKPSSTVVIVKSTVSSTKSVEVNTTPEDFNLDSNIFSISNKGNVNMYKDGEYGPHGTGELSFTIKSGYKIIGISIIQTSGGVTKVSLGSGESETLVLKKETNFSNVSSSSVSIKNISGKLSRISKLEITYEPITTP